MWQDYFFLLVDEIEFLSYSWITEVVWVLKVLQNAVRLYFIKVLNIYAFKERVDFHDVLIVVLFVLNGVC